MISFATGIVKRNVHRNPSRVKVLKCWLTQNIQVRLIRFICMYRMVALYVAVASPTYRLY